MRPSHEAAPISSRRRVHAAQFALEHFYTLLHVITLIARHSMTTCYTLLQLLLVIINTSHDLVRCELYNLHWNTRRKLQLCRSAVLCSAARFTCASEPRLWWSPCGRLLYESAPPRGWRGAGRTWAGALGRAGAGLLVGTPLAGGGAPRLLALRSDAVCKGAPRRRRSSERGRCVCMCA